MMLGLVGKCEGKSPFGIHRLRCESNVRSAPGCGAHSLCLAVGRVTGCVVARASVA